MEDMKLCRQFLVFLHVFTAVLGLSVANETREDNPIVISTTTSPPSTTTMSPNVALIAGVTVGVIMMCLICCMICVACICWCVCIRRSHRNEIVKHTVISAKPDRLSYGLDVRDFNATPYGYCTVRESMYDIPLSARQMNPIFRRTQDQAIRSTPSTYFQTAKLRGKVRFLYHHVLVCDYHGHELIIGEHDITIKVPEGAVTTGKRVYLEVGVTMFGPFNFTNNSQPISPILWLCFIPSVNDVTDRLSLVLKKPIEVTLPHILTGLTSSQLQDHHVSFSKANHFNNNPEYIPILYEYEFDISYDYDFQPVEGNSTVTFTSSENKSYGTLETFHCCFLCMEAQMSPKLVTDTSYCLVRMESSVPPRSEIHFAVTYFLKTCLKALEEQYSDESGFTVVRHREFKFKQRETEPCIPLKISVPEDAQSYTLAMEPTNAEIYPDDVDFWKKDYDDLLLRHEKRMYPPRVIVTVVMKEPDAAVSIPVTFSGCENSDQLNTKLMFPLAHTAQDIKPPDRKRPRTEPVNTANTEINLSEAFKKLLPLAHKWESIATFLNVPTSVQNKIEKEEKAVDDCLRKVLAYRIDQMDTPLTWSELADAVDPFDKSLANKLRTEVL